MRWFDNVDHRDPIGQLLKQSADLRSYCQMLRDHSRELKARSVECRTRGRHAAAHGENVKGDPVQSEAESRELDRLFRAESDLRAAISDCSTALAEVRREIGWRDRTPAAVIH